MSISKPHEERRLEILQAAEHLFVTQGYAKTTVEQILQYVGIAKGTLYYHFRSKSEMLDGIIMLYVKKGMEAAEHIAADPNLRAHDKLKLVLRSQSYEHDNKKELIQQIHHIENAELHLKSLTESIKHISPIIAKIVQQGIDEGIYRTEHVQEVIEFLLVASQFLLDIAIFNWNREQLLKRAEAFQSIIETVLHAEAGSFQFITEMYSQFVIHFNIE